HRPQNKEELFNLRHAQLRNVIEHIFSVLKNKFRMACKPCNYPIQIQCLIALALAILHNYFHIYGPDHNSSNFSMPPVRDTVAGL
ncbi:hypothetical protein BT96DRAFT_832250, partial [Gymnopus androsaceus JB14]